MKKIQLIVTVLVAAALFISCKNSKGVSKPDDIGKYAFAMLKDFDNITKDNYINSIFTIDEIKAFGKRNAETLESKALKEIKRLEKGNYNRRMGNDYNRLKERAKKEEISWNAIAYDDYEFEERDEDGIKAYRGKLTFKHKDKTYNVSTISVLIEETYTLVRIFRLNKEAK